MTAKKLTPLTSTKAANVRGTQKNSLPQNENKAMGSCGCKTSASNTQVPATIHKSTASATTSCCHSGDSKKGHKTRVTIKYDVGFSNTLTIRGKGANLSWNKGTPLKNVKSDEWVWETEGTFTSCEFKVLLNDANYELGENHILTSGSSLQYTPKF